MRQNTISSRGKSHAVPACRTRDRHAANAQRLHSGCSKGKQGKRRQKRQLRVRLRIVFLVLLALAGLCAWPYISSWKSIETGAQVPEGYHKFGIDISSYQKKIVWDSLKVLIDAKGRTTRSLIHADGIRKVSFVFIKATEGTQMKDKMFEEHWDNAGKAGIRRGAYHFFRSSKDPEKQAANFISAVKSLEPDDLPPVLDVETLHKGCTRDIINKNVRTWLGIVERHFGRKPVIYSSENFLLEILDDDLVDSYTIWCAKYGNIAPSPRRWKYWQFTDNGVVHGISGYVDINVLR